MKKLLKVLKWILIVLVALILIVVTVFWIIGFPKPDAITVESVPKLPVSKALPLFMAVGQSNQSTRFDSWSNEPNVMNVVKYSNLAAYYHRLSDGAGTQSVPIDSIPENVYVTFNPNPARNNAIYAVDSEGDENYQIYFVDFEKGESALLSDGKSPHFTALFSRDGDKLLFTSGRRNQKDHDVYLMDLLNPGSERLIIENTGSTYLDSFSPDGTKAIIRLGAASRTPHILDLQTSKLTALDGVNGFSEGNTYGPHLWSNDGSKIYYIASESSDFQDVRIRNMATGNVSVISKDIPWDATEILESPDSNWLVFIVNQDGINQLHTFNLSTKELAASNPIPKGSVLDASFHPLEGSKLGFNLRYLSGGLDIFSYELASGELTQWSDTRIESDLPEPQTIRYPTFDIDEATNKKRLITAFLHRPRKSIAPPYPIIVDIHGGPSTQVTPEGNLLIQTDLDRGFAVLAPNVRGSTGYGKTFENLDNGMLRENAVKDIGALLDWIAEQPDLDADRVIVRGGSYGGYMSLASAVHYSDRLVGAISWSGFSNFVTALDSEDISIEEELDIQEYGDFRDPDMRAFLGQISPANNTDQITVPLFLVQGEKDARIPVTEARKIVEKIIDAGKIVWYIEAANEGHIPKNPMNFIYSKVAEFEFIDTVTSTPE